MTIHPLAVVVLSLACQSVFGQATNEQPFSLYSRVTSTTWPQIKPSVRDDDLFWGRQVEGIPATNQAFLFSSYAALEKRLADEDLRNYAALNLDGEYRDYDVALEETKKIRSFVDSHNTKHKDEPEYRPLNFIAFYHMRIIDARPEIVKYPDVVLIGKSYWNADNIRSDGSRQRRSATSYVKMIRDAGREPGILLGSPEKADQSAEEIIKTIKVCVASKSDGGLGVRIIGFYYERDEADTLIQVLTAMRSPMAIGCRLSGPSPTAEQHSQVSNSILATLRQQSLPHESRHR